MQPKDATATLRFVASPAAAEGIIVCPTAKNGPVFAVAPNKRGNLTDSDAVLWVRGANTPDVPSPLIHEDLVYLCRESGILLVLERETGDEVYMERTHTHRHRASPVYADGHVYLTPGWQDHGGEGGPRVRDRRTERYRRSHVSLTRDLRRHHLPANL